MTKVNKNVEIFRFQNSKIKIDSFKLRIPKRLVKVIDARFLQKYQKVYITTGDIEEDVNLDKHKVFIENGITTRIGLLNFMNGETNEQEEYFIFQINAKKLKSEYFHGINENNIKKIYDYLMSFKLVFVDYQVFLDGLISDIDLCFDFESTPQSLIESNQKIYENVQPNCLRYMGKPFRQKHNIGIMFNERSKATPSKPYLKIYHKSVELESKSSDFRETYLQGIDTTNIARLEYTIKNSRQKIKLGLNFTTLQDFLGIPQEMHETYFFGGIKQYTSKRTLMRDRIDLNSTDMLILGLIDRCIDKGDDKQYFYNLIDQLFDDRKQRYKMRKKLEILLNNVSDENQLILNKGVMDNLRILRLDF